MDWGRIYPWGKTRQVIGGLGDTFLDGLSQLERAGNWFLNFGWDCPVLGRGSCDRFSRG